MKFFLFLFFAVSSASQSQDQLKPVVKTGIDVLVESNFSILKGKRVGLITNPTGVTGGLVSAVDVFAHSRELKLVALFAPEHGVRGDFAAGTRVDSYVDSATGVPVYSLYGKTTKPTAEMVRGVDALVYDIQDIGVRSYTYINTMAKAMAAASENGIEFVVLDRPNPLTGNEIEGNVLDTKFKSFVGMFPIPYVYGLTCGELATLLNDEGWLEGGRKCKLNVVMMEGWKRSMWWEDTGLQWVPTSPHIPNAATALFCAATGIIGELDGLSVGIGYTLPFQLVGAPWIDAQSLAQTLNNKKIAGAYFRPVTYTPFYGAMQGRQVNGVQIYIVNRDKVNLIGLQLYIVQAINELYPAKDVFVHSDSSRIRMFDNVIGTDSVRIALENKVPAGTIISGWKNEVNTFLSIRKKYLLYN
ncbi:MAG: DUF1343 domain-containing protein [Bacteroidota bacterium]